MNEEMICCDCGAVMRQEDYLPPVGTWKLLPDGSAILLGQHGGPDQPIPAGVVAQWAKGKWGAARWMRCPAGHRGGWRE